MKSKRLRRLQTATTVVLLLGLVLFFLTAIVIPNGATLWADKQWADEQIRGAQTLEQLQALAHSAAGSIAFGQHLWGTLLYIFMYATIGMVSFLGWSLFTITRIKREDSSDHDDA